jgi:hypothetical protein
VTERTVVKHAIEKRHENSKENCKNKEKAKPL